MRILMTSLIALTLSVPNMVSAQTTSLSSPVAAPVKMLTANEAKADIALMRRGLETVHPGLTRYTSQKDIDAAFAKLEAVATAPVDTLILHREMALMLAKIHCDHTKAEMSDALTDYRKTNPTHLPFRFRLIEGRMIVVSNDGQTDTPPVGAEILSINNKQVPMLLITLGNAVAFDGDTNQAIAAKLGNDSDLMGDDFNENYPSFFGFPAQWDIKWKTLGTAQEKSVSLKPISFDRWVGMDAPEGVQRNEFYKSITWRLEGDVAQLKIDTFVNYRNPVETTAFVGSFFKAMKSAGTMHLILDLRNNGGGSEDVPVALGRYLFDTPFTWTRPLRYKTIRYGDLPDHIESWGDRDALFNPPVGMFIKTKDGWYDRKVDPSISQADDTESTIEHLPVPDLHFTGKLTILTGPRNGSAATQAVAQFKEKRGARLVGEDTTGSAEGPTAGQIFLTTLPNSGLKLRIPSAWNRTDIEHFVPKQGVAVDELVIPTLADFSANRDRTLEVARDFPAAVLNSDRAAIIASVFKGNWQGNLDYRDYRNDGRVTLPTLLDSTGTALKWTYDDGPGKIVKSEEKWSYDAKANSVSINQDVFKVSEFAVSGADKAELTMVLDGSGSENDVKKIVRIILTRRGNMLRISRLSRATGEPFIMRDAYEMKRMEN